MTARSSGGPRLARGGGSTAIGDVIERSFDVGQTRSGAEESDGSSGREESSNGPPLVVLLLSDGENTTGINPKETADRAHELGVRFTGRARAEEVTVFVRARNGIRPRLEFRARIQPHP